MLLINLCLLLLIETSHLTRQCIAKSGSPLKICLTGEEHQQESTKHTDMDKVYQVMYILDRFAVSDEAYHEIRMASKQSGYAVLPPLYVVKQTRKEMNSSMVIERLPGVYPGAFRPLLDLLRKEISHAVIKNCSTYTIIVIFTLSKLLQISKEHTLTSTEDTQMLTGGMATSAEERTIMVKFSGDGARFSRSSNIILFSFSLPELQNNALSGAGTCELNTLSTENYFPISV